MPNALIYSPRFDGHRPVHVFVYADILRELDFNIFIAGNINEKIADPYYVDKFKKDKSITMIDTSIYEKNGLEITNDEFIELQKSCKTDLTVFAEADHHLYLFNTQIFNRKKKLLGKRVGLFLRPFYYYEKLSFLNKLRYIKHLNSNWKYDGHLFHAKLLKQFHLLDSALYLDENFAAHHKHTVFVPDVFQQYAEMLLKSESPDQKVWMSRINDFKEKNSGRFIFLYFGTSQPRRGYDSILKMAVEHDACFIHCGLKNDKEDYKYDVNELRSILNDKGRLMETNEYITDPLCIELFFKSVNHLVLPYSGFYGSSGVMLMALGNGIPVLVPHEGIMGYLVKKYNLGLTYKNDNTLFERFKEFEKLPSESFRNSISDYMRTQTPEELKRKLISVFKNQ